jgi:hypothetical protein
MITRMTTSASMTASPAVNLHQLGLVFESAAAGLRTRFEQIYGHLPPAVDLSERVMIDWQLAETEMAPLPAGDLPVLAAGEMVSYYGEPDLVTIRMPKYALLTVDLKAGSITGKVTSRILTVYGAFEDVLLIALAPIYRRRGWFPLHAFAGLAPSGQAALISGPMGSGKTTTGLSLLNAGWKLLSNDSPLLTLREDQVHVLSYPGRLSAFDNSLARFENLKKFIPAEVDRPGEQIDQPKRIFGAEEVYADPWAESSVAGGIFFPQVVAGLSASELVKVPPAQAILQLIPQAIEGWDKTAIAHYRALLRRLVEHVPCYHLRLSPQVEALPDLLAQGLAQADEKVR